MSQRGSGGEPTEEPTPRRLAEARRQGRIARSTDLTSAAAFAAGVGALIAWGSYLTSELTELVRAHLSSAVSSQPEVLSTLGRAPYDVLRLTLPVLGAAFALAAICGALQARGLFVLAPLSGSARLSPWAGFQRIVSGRTLAVSLLTLVKLLVVSAVVYGVLAPRVGELFRLPSVPPRLAFAWLTEVAGTLASWLALVAVLLGGADLLWQRHVYRKELLMTRAEVTREHKELEGDPRHKAERQRLYRALSRKEGLEAVRAADCVVFGPDPIAVALSFDEERMAAPQVVAKGEGLAALEIEEVARRSGVPLTRDVALARALNETELGDEIPPALYEAVAEILGHSRAHVR